jgi:hypothetical protein
VLDELIGELFDGLLTQLVPDRPAVLYGLPTALLGGWLATAADRVPYLALVAGVVLAGVLSIASERTELRRARTEGNRSAADWAVVAVFLLVVGGIVVVGEVDAVTVSVTAVLGVMTGLLAGASATEWLLPAVRARTG